MFKVELIKVNMKNIHHRLISRLVLILSFSFFVISCDDGDDDDSELGNWIQSSYFEGQPRSGAVVFTIENRAYVGLGYDGDDYFSDFYAYDPDRELWDDVAPFPGSSRERAVAFSVNGKGYVGLGYNRDLDTEELKDFWEYDPTFNTWSQIADFTGTARYNAVAFAIGSRGYVGTGYDGDYYRSDFFAYDPSTNTWIEIANFPGGKREEALAIVFSEKAYFMTGRNNGVYNSDLWVFDPEGEKVWTEITPDDEEDYYDEFVAAVRRHDANALVLNDKIYIVNGNTGSTSSTVYEFNPLTGFWDTKTSFEGSERYLGIAFTLQNRGFVGLGQNSTRRWDDIWEFFPDIEYDDAD
jgi:N-acetylneuraminic acid mutarotase